MKKALVAVMCSAMVLSAAGCGTSGNEVKTGEISNVEIVEKGVNLFVKDGTLTNTGATFILANNSDKDIQYDEPYRIEVKENGEWHKIDVEVAFIQPLYTLKPNETAVLEIGWENGYGKLPDGTYRLVKTVNYDDVENYESFDVAAEFTIG